MPSHKLFELINEEKWKETGLPTAYITYEDQPNVDRLVESEQAEWVLVSELGYCLKAK